MSEKCINLAENTFPIDVENRTLQEQIANIGTNSYVKLSKHIFQLIIRCADTLGICQEDRNFSENDDLTDIFTTLKNHLEQVIEAYVVANQKVKLLKDEHSKMRAENSAKIKLISEIECRLSSCRKQLEMLHSGNMILEQRNETFRKQLEKYKRDARRLSKEHLRTKTHLDNIQKQREQTKRVTDERMNQLTVDNATLEPSLSAIQAKFKSLSEQCAKLEKDTTLRDREISGLRGQLQEKATKIDGLEQINEKLLSTIGRHIQEHQAHDYTRKSNDEPNFPASKEDDLDETTGSGIECLSESRGQNHRFNQITKEIEKLNQHISQMENELKEKSMTNYNLEVKLAASDKQICEMKAKLLEVTKSHDNLQQEKGTLENIVSESKLKLQTSQEELEILEQTKINVELKLQNENKDLEEQLKSLRATKSRLENKIQALVKTTLSAQDGGRGDEIHSTDLENSIEYLRERVVSLLSANNKLSSTGVEQKNMICALKDQVDELRHTADEYKTVCNSLKTEVVQAECKIHSLKSENYNLSTTIYKLNSRIEAMQHNSQEHIQEQSHAHVQTRDLSEKFKSVCLERVELLDQVTTLTCQCKDLESTVTSLQNEIKDQQAIEADLKSKVSESDEYIMQLIDEREKLEKRLGESDLLSDSIKKEKEILNEELQTLSSTTSSKNARLVSLQQENVELLEQASKLNKELTNTKDAVLEIQMELLRTKQELERKEIAFQAELRGNQRLTKSLAELRSYRDHLEQVIRARESKMKDLEEEVSTLESSFEGSEKKIREMQHMLRAVKDERESEKETVENLQVRISLLEKERTLLEDANKDHLDNIIQMENSLRRAQSINAELLLQLDKATKDSGRQNDYVSLQLRYVAICAEKEKLEISKQQLQHNCDKLCQRIEALTGQLKNLQGSVENLGKCSDASQIEIRALRKAFCRNKWHNQELRNKLNSVQHELDAANEEIARLEKLRAKETNKSAALTEEIECLQVEIENVRQFEAELRIANDNVTELQKLYDEKVTKYLCLDNEIQKLRIQLESKQLELNDQNAFLIEVKSDLESKLEIISKLSSELATARRFNEKLQEEIEQLTIKNECLLSIETKLRQTQNIVDALVKENSISKLQIQELSASIVYKKESILQSEHTTVVTQELESKLEKLLSMLGKMSTSLETTQIENKELRLENTQLKHGINNFYEACQMTFIDLLEISDERVDDETNNYQKKCMKLVESIDKFHNLNQKLRDENVSLTSTVNASREENLKLSDNISQQSEDILQLKKENILLTNNFNELQSTYEKLFAQKEVAYMLNLQILASFKQLEMQQNSMIRQHIASNDEVSKTLTSYEALKEQLEVLRVEKHTTDKESSRQLTQLEEKLRYTESQLRRERDLNKQLKIDAAIFHAKLLRSRLVTEEKEKHWEWVRAKLAYKLQTTEKGIQDKHAMLRHRFEHMRNKMTQCSTVNLSRTDLAGTFLCRSDKTNEQFATLQTLSQLEVQIHSYCPSEIVGWRRRCRKAIKVVVFNIILAVLFKDMLSRNNLEVILRQTVPSVL